MLRDNLLTLECEVAGGIGLMRMEGELIAESRYEPERILREWLEAEIYRVVVHFGGVTHIDSAGLSTLLGAMHRYRRHDGDLILAEMNPSLSAIFEHTSMQAYFKIFDDVEGARKHFGPPPAPKKKRAAAGVKGRKAGAKKTAKKGREKIAAAKAAPKSKPKQPAKRAAPKKPAAKATTKSRIVVKKKSKKVAR